MKKLNEIIETTLDININGITDDSRKVKKDYLFVATQGYNVDHYDYIEDAIKNGASFIISDRELDNFPHIVVDNINDYYYELCEKYYDVSPLEFSIIGITGTDGKTTTTSVINQIIDNSAYIGTNGLYVGNKIYNTNNTTPCISELYESLKIIKDNNIKTIIMEVSSEALLHDRLKNFKFDIIGFTNITEDHLNIHKTLDNYIKCKMKLLDLLKENGYCVINGDDSNLQAIKCKNLVKIGVNNSNDYVIKDVKFNDNAEFYVNNKYIKSPLLGMYNIYNVTMSFVISKLFGIKEDIIIDKINKIKTISGRREVLDFSQDYTIILDYAHTYNGILNIINSVSDYKDIIVVTGCAGGREKEKRSKIGKMILDKCNTAIFTMDDPRYEDVNDIIDDMVSDSNKSYIRIIDRKEAIYKAFDIAKSDSVVLILGKGRDNYMAIEDRKEEYSDYDVIEDYFK